MEQHNADSVQQAGQAEVLSTGTPIAAQTIVEESDTQNAPNGSPSKKTKPKPKPDQLIPMKDFIARNDRARFKWVDNIEKDDTAKDLDPKDQRMRKHVKLQCPGSTPSIPFEKLGKRLGVGHNSKVEQCYYPKSGYRRPLAVKVLDCVAYPKVPIKKALVEVEIMEHLAHPHVVTYVASYEMTVLNQDDTPEDQVLGIVMYPPGVCDLKTALKDISCRFDEHSRIRVDDQDLLRIRHMFGFFGCLAQALSYLHTTDVIIKHKDIKPANIIIDSFEQPLITDFGISKRYADKGQASSHGGHTWTSKYAPPEAFAQTETCGFRADVFSLGCVFLEMATVLLGVSLEALDAHLEGKYYYRVIDKVIDWLTNTLPSNQAAQAPNRCGLNDFLHESKTLRIKEGGQLEVSAREALLGVLDTIAKMLSRSAKDRPHADELYEMLEPLYQFTPAGHACDICKLQHETRIVPGAREGYTPPMETADYPSGMAEAKKELPEEPLDDESDHQTETRTLAPRDQQTPYTRRETQPEVLSHRNRVEQTHGTMPGDVPLLALQRSSMTGSPAITHARRRTTTLSFIRRATNERRRRKILLYDLRPSQSPSHHVYIANANNHLNDDVTPVPIKRMNLNVTFETRANDHEGDSRRNLMRSVDLKKQGVAVFLRAFFGRNKHVYVRGRVNPK